jgi:hypothetical protein
VGFGIFSFEREIFLMTLRVILGTYRVDDMFVDDFVMLLYQQSYTAELPFLRHMKALNLLYKINLLTLAKF